VSAAPPNQLTNREKAEAIAGRPQADLDNTLGVLRERVDQEFQRTERLDSKSRQAFALSAGLFALTQAGAFASFAEDAVDSHERLGILVGAILALAALGLTAVRLHHAEDLREEQSLPLQSIHDWSLEPQTDRLLTARLILSHLHVAAKRTKSNAARVEQVKSVRTAAALTLAICATELIVALGVRM
jgi:hypothetical protein